MFVTVVRCLTYVIGGASEAPFVTPCDQNDLCTIKVELDKLLTASGFGNHSQSQLTNRTF